MRFRGPSVTVSMIAAIALCAAACGGTSDNNSTSTTVSTQQSSPPPTSEMAAAVAIPDGDMKVQSGTIVVGCDQETDTPIRAFNTDDGTFVDIAEPVAADGDSEYELVDCAVAGSAADPVIVLLQSNATPASGTRKEVRHCMLTAVPIRNSGAPRHVDVQNDLADTCEGLLFGSDSAVGIGTANEPTYRLNDLSKAWELGPDSSLFASRGPVFIASTEGGYAMRSAVDGRVLATAENAIYPVSNSSFFGSSNKCVDDCTQGTMNIFNGTGQKVATILDPDTTDSIQQVTASNDIIASFSGPGRFDNASETDFFETYDARTGQRLFGLRGIDAGDLRTSYLYAYGTDVYMFQEAQPRTLTHAKIDGRTGRTIATEFSEFPIDRFPNGWTVFLGTENGTAGVGGVCTGVTYDDDCQISLRKG